jgi:hypothetical protein
MSSDHGMFATNGDAMNQCSRCGFNPDSPQSPPNDVRCLLQKELQAIQKHIADLEATRKELETQEADLRIAAGAIEAQLGMP